LTQPLEPHQVTAVHVGDEAELAGVRWASLAEAEELLPDMFNPVCEHPETTLTQRSSRSSSLRSAAGSIAARGPQSTTAIS
jgi:hypothetical protein